MWIRIVLMFITLLLIQIADLPFKSKLRCRWSVKLKTGIFEYPEHEPDNMLKQMLEQTINELNTLRTKHSDLLAISRFCTRSVYYSNYSLNTREGKLIMEEYENLRRRIYSNTQELGLYLNNKLVVLENETFTVHKKQAILEEAAVRKRLLLSDQKKLATLDGYSDWRIKEARILTELVQQRLWHLQNPPDCRSQKKLVCHLNKNYCGFGCQIHHVVYCLIFGYATERTVILNSEEWRYYKNGWDHVFHPLSENCTSVYNDEVVPWPAPENSRVISIPFLEELAHKPAFLPLAVPKDLASRITKFNGDPPSWWIGQMLKFIMRPQNMLQGFINKAIAKTNFEFRIVGVHVRRTDKIGVEAFRYDISEYMRHVGEYYAQLELTRALTHRSVYLATDEPRVFEEARQKYPEYTFFGDPGISETAEKDRYTPQSLYGLIVDLHLLAKCDFFVGTFTSQFGRVVYEMMQAIRVDASQSYHSLDAVYHFVHQNEPDLIVVDPRVELDEIINKVGSTTFLGFEIDRSLTWENHIDTLCGKISGACFALRRVARVVSPEVSRACYFATVHSRLQYGAELYARAADWERAFRAQKRAVRAIVGVSRFTSVKPYFKDLALRNNECSVNLDSITNFREEFDLKTKEISTLKLRIKQLMSIQKFGLKSLRPLKSLSLAPSQYETIRHRIYSRTKDLWFYTKQKLGEIARDDFNLTKINEFLHELTERKRCLLLEQSELGAVDGHAEWRRVEARRLAELVQRRLRRLQDPPHCAQARKLVCNLNKNGGFGCQIHHVAHCLSVGYATNRTVVLNSSGWQYSDNGWEEYFHPISSCSMDTIQGVVEDWTESSTAKTMLVPEIEAISPKPEYILPALPEDIYHRIVLFNGNPLAWWVGQIVTYILKPLDQIQEVVNRTVSKLNKKSTLVGIHIRRTDKINAAEAVYHDLDEYMQHVEEYFAQLQLTTTVTERRVYIATDDIYVMDEVRQLRIKYSQYTFLLERGIVETAAVARRRTRRGLEGLLTDLAVLASCDYVVCTFSSNVGRLVYELMQINRLNGAYSADSLDDVYYLSNIYAQDRIAVMGNVAGDNDLSMEIGDQIGLVPGGHRDGYDLGTNKRTMMTGLIPWYKTAEDPVLYRAPKYDDQL